MRSSFIEKNHDFYLYFDIMIYNCIRYTYSILYC